MAIESILKVIEQHRMNSQDSKSLNQNVCQKNNENLQSKSSYKCDECKDTGWILTISEVGQPVAKKCRCKEMEDIERQWTASGINPKWSNQNFGNFNVWNESSKRLKEVAIAYYKDFDSMRENRQNSILLCGQVGCGKTHISVALSLNLLKKKVKVIYMPYRDSITKIKQNMLDEDYYNKIISKFKSCEMLLIDDLFKGKITDADINIIFEILNYRYLNHLPIIISTEFTVEDLLNFDEGIGSRIYEMCKSYIVENRSGKNENYRLR